MWCRGLHQISSGILMHNVSGKVRTKGNSKKFSELQPGMEGCILGYSNQDSCSKRLQEMGLCPGTTFKVIKVAPLGDPVEVEFRACRLCLRRSETEQIDVEVNE